MNRVLQGAALSMFIICTFGVTKILMLAEAHSEFKVTVWMGIKQDIVLDNC